MDPQGNIYPVSDLPIDEQDTIEVKEDIARLDGFLRGRAESDRIKHEKVMSRRHETQIHDSTKDGTFRNGGT